MNREILGRIILSSGANQETAQTILTDADNYAIYDQLNNNTQFTESLREIESSQITEEYNLAIRKIIGIIKSTIKTKKQEAAAVRQRRQQIVEHIKQEMLPQANIVIKTSNTTPESEKEIDWLCSLKAFSIEYMLKSIETLADAADNNNPRNRNIENLVQDFIREAKGRLTDRNPGHRYNGHEIKAIFNSLIPPHIKTLIKYKSITNSIDPNVKTYGKIISPVNGDESMGNFIADYLLAIKDCDLTEKSAENNRMLDRNNKAFINYRYRDQHAELSDYELLNCMMVSTYMTLTFLLEHPDLVREYDSENIISYNALEGELSEEEYNHLKELGTTNGYDTNSLLTYHMFLKHYLKDRTPKLDDDRYSRINNLFEQIRETNDISQTSEIFANWFKNTDINSLSKEELKELKIIAPEFVYNSLSYEDKLIFKKCQEKGIEFEYYYKMNPECFETLINNYSTQLKGCSIDIAIIGKRPQVASNLMQTLKELNLDISELPSYYFEYSAEDIKRGYHNRRLFSETKSKFLDEIELTSAWFENGKEFQWNELKNRGDLHPVGRFKIDMLEKKDEFMLQKHQLSMRLAKRLKYTKERELERVKLIDSGQINESNYSKIGLTREEFDRCVLMVKVAKKYKADNLTPFLNMSTTELHERDSTETYSTPIIIEKLDERNPKMLKKENSELEMGDYLLYKTPEETQEIINLCREQGITFRPEFLYFNMDLCRSNLPAIDLTLIGADVASDGLIDYYKAQEINERLSERMLKSSPVKNNTETHSAQPQEELSEMFVEEHNTKPSATHISRAS